MLDDIRKAGDYLTTEHLGKPLLIQNQGDRIADGNTIATASSARFPAANSSSR
jgi:hypothetical protein